MEQKVTRRDALKHCLIASAALGSVTLTPVHAREVGRLYLDADPSQPPIRTPKLFRTSEFMVGQPTDFLPHADILQKISSTGYVNGLLQKNARLRSLVEKLRGKPAMEQIEAVNSFVNTFPYRSDVQRAGQRDSWATPAEFYRVGGDCEDFSLAKYSTLRALGFHSYRMRLVLLEDNETRQYHAALAVYYNGKAWLLDNQNKRVLSTDQISRYKPLASMTHKDMWVHGEQPNQRQRFRSPKFKQFVLEQRLRALSSTGVSRPASGK